MNTIVCLASTNSVGATFMDWSVHFLSGQTQFYNVDQGWIPLTHNPLDENNAHNHLRNHPGGLAETQSVLNTLTQQSGLVSLYPYTKDFDKSAAELGISSSDLTQQNCNRIAQYTIKDYATALNVCNQQGARIIYLTLPKEYVCYRLQLRTKLKKWFDNHSDIEIKKHNDQLFLKNSQLQWEDLSLTEIWDQREHRALATRPLDLANEIAGFEFPHLYLNCVDWWFNGETTICKVMKFLELSISTDRWQHWLATYHQWKSVHVDAAEFCHNLQHIVDSIVNNWYFEIDLTFDQEVVIQHCLIYQHGLNLKTWQLTKFPNNTQDLHKLLEVNTHSLTV